MPIVPCPQCAKPMEEDDGFCGSCGAITDPDLTLDDGPTDRHTLAPAPVQLSPIPSAEAPPDRLAALGVLDLGGGFDERTDVAPSPLDDPSAPVPVVEKPADDFQAFLEERTGAFTADASLFEEETGSHSADRLAMVQPQVVLRCKPGVDSASLSPFEQHVLSFLDGRRPLARLRKKAGLSFGDLKVAIGMLADRGAIEVVGNFVPDLRALLEDDDLADHDPAAIPPSTPPPPPPRPIPTAPKPVQRAAPMPLPGQGTFAKPAPTVPARAAPTAGSPVVVVAAPAVDAAQVQANQLLERALTELRAGKRPAAVALLHMAAELLPDDPRIEAALKSLTVR